jgi:hypothetical protein
MDSGGRTGVSSNYPTRGGKQTFWEGGVRVEAFVHSPLLPAAVRNTEWAGLAHACDWFATIIEGVAGVDMPANTGPMSVDGVNLWPALTTGGQSPRSEVVIQAAPANVDTTRAIRVGDYKLIVSSSTLAPTELKNTVSQPFASPPSPVAFGQSRGNIEPGTDHCSVQYRNLQLLASPTCASGCLFDVVNDISESIDLASDPAHSARLASMQARLTAAAVDAQPSSFWLIDINRAQQSVARDALCAATGVLMPADVVISPSAPTPLPTPAPPTPTPPPVSAPPPPWSGYTRVGGSDATGCCLGADGSDVPAIAPTPANNDCGAFVMLADRNPTNPTKWLAGECRMLAWSPTAVALDDNDRCRCWRKTVIASSMSSGTVAQGSITMTVAIVAVVAVVVAIAAVATLRAKKSIQRMASAAKVYPTQQTCGETAWSDAESERERTTAYSF